MGDSVVVVGAISSHMQQRVPSSGVLPMQAGQAANERDLARTHGVALIHQADNAEKVQGGDQVAFDAEAGQAQRVEAADEAPTAEIDSFLRARRLEMSVHEEAGRIMTKVLDAESGDVIREIPPEEMVDMLLRFQEGSFQMVQEQA